MIFYHFLSTLGGPAPSLEKAPVRTLRGALFPVPAGAARWRRWRNRTAIPASLSMLLSARGVTECLFGADHAHGHDLRCHRRGIESCRAHHARSSGGISLVRALR